MVYEQEVSFRDYILKARSYFGEVLRYWYIPLAFGLLGAAYKAYKYSNYVAVYTAEITFSIDEDEGGSGSGLTGMLSQFGLGNVRPARYNFDKILELSKSRRVVQATMFERITINGKEDFLANHIIEIYNLRNDGETDTDVISRFTHDSFPGFSRAENELLKYVYGIIIGPPKRPELALLNAGYNDDSNIMSLSASTKNETLSIELARRMFESLSNYYVNRSIEKAQRTYEIVSMKRDSVLGVLRSSEYQLANFEDRSRGLIMRSDQVPKLRLQREIGAMSAMYAEVLKNTEVADFSLRTKTPFIQVIDLPIPPLYPSQLSFFRSVLMGFALGAIAGTIFVAARKAYKDIMSENKVISVT